LSYPIITTRIASSTFALLRSRTRQVGELFGLEKLQCTRFITAVSEIARNAVQFAGGGIVKFRFEEGAGEQSTQYVIAEVSDSGPGIADLASALEGQAYGHNQNPLGLVGSKRLVDVFNIECPKNAGTVVTMQMALPRTAKRISRADIGRLVDELARHKGQTPLEELEKQNREMLGTLQELRLRQLQLERADERKNHFVAMVAHELRNPLGTLKMTLEIIRRSPAMAAAALDKRRAVMERQTDHLSQLIDDLMDASRVSQGKFELDKRSVEVNELVAQAVEISGSAIAAKRHQLQVQRHLDDLWIDGDPIRLKQVLCNLIQNAARYTPTGGKLAISIDMQGDCACICVSDSGIGISPDMLPQVFDLFVQADSTLSESRNGLGVGLTLVRSLVERHGGRVVASSDGLGLGSQFSIFLPLATVHGDSSVQLTLP